MSFTPTDRRILVELQKDASRSMSEIAEAAGTSPATCWRRVKHLEESGVLGPMVRLVEPAAVGRPMDAFCQVRIKSQDAKSREEFQRSMDLEPAIVEVYSISGEWDYLVHLLVRDMADLESILMKRMLEHEYVAGTSTIFAMRRIKHVTEIPI